MKYGDDQCEEWGGVRVNRSILCVDCLVKACAFKDLTIRHLTNKKEDLEKRVENYRGQLENALAYGFKQNQENMKLRQRTKELCLKIREVMEDGKNWKAENTEE